MMNNTSSTIMLQTIIALMHNATDIPVLTGNGMEGMELERCYEAYGCFTIAFPWTAHRPDNKFPDSVAFMHIRYPAFTRRNRKIPAMLEADNVEKIEQANLDPRGPFYLISHGFLDGGDKSWIQNMTNALLNIEGNEAATVLVVDWRGGSQPPYSQAVANIRLVGMMTAHFVHNIYEVLGLSNLDNFHFIGHSLGAHLAGYCGHALQKKFNLKLGRITGLDPAGPHFSETVTLMRLDRTDAHYVDIIHSDAMPLYYAGLGMSEKIGHVDFYPNGGAKQPGCKNADNAWAFTENLYSTMKESVGCSHKRSYEFFTESISPSCPFMAIQCESYEAFVAGNCKSCSNKHLCIPMGYHSHRMYKKLLSAGWINPNPNFKLALYANTGASKPYCRVHYVVELKVSNSTENRKRGADIGKVAITLIDRDGIKSDTKVLDDEKKYYKPGFIEKKIVAVKDTGHPPQTVMVDWIYESNPLMPSTWRLLEASSTDIEYIKLSSIEYNTDITVCPENGQRVIDKVHRFMKPKFCKF